MQNSEKLIEAAGGWDAVSVVFDVGANDGADFTPLARTNLDVRFVAVEPTPRLADALRRATVNLQNYTVVECAVATTEGQAEFHIIEGYNGGLNSLHSPRPLLFEHGVGEDVEDVQVVVRRLDSIADELDITHVDVLHVDTQGSDLDVLRSAGPLLETVKAGQVEVTVPQKRFYDDTPTPDDVAGFLWDAGFSIVAILPNDALGAEKNFIFARRSAGWTRVYRRLYPFLFRLAPVVHPVIALRVHVRHLRSRAAIRTRWRRIQGSLGRGA